MFEHEAFDLFHHLRGALDGGAGRQLYVDQQRALIFRRQERRWQAGVHQRHNTNDGSVDDHVAASAAQHPFDQAFIAVGGV